MLRLYSPSSSSDPPQGPSNAPCAARAHWRTRPQPAHPSPVASPLREAGSLEIDVLVSHRCEPHRGVAKRQARVGWAMRRGDASAVGGVGAVAQELVGVQSWCQG